MIVGRFVRQMFQKVSRKEIKSQGKFLADRCQRKEGQRLGRSSMPADQSEGAMQVSGEDEQPLCRMALHTENQVKDRRKQERYVAEVTIPIVQMSLPPVQHNTIDTNQTADWQAKGKNRKEKHTSHTKVMMIICSLVRKKLVMYVYRPRRMGKERETTARQIHFQDDPSLRLITGSVLALALA